MKKTIFPFLLSSILYSISFSALADSPRTADWLLAKYDQDGDQAISIEEISQKRERAFSLMDADQDGDVSLAEYAQMDALKREQILRARFSKLDTNQDGHVSTEEYRAYSGSFDRFDQDRNGIITAAEIQAKPAKVASQDDTKCLLWFCLKTKLD